MKIYLSHFTVQYHENNIRVVVKEAIGGAGVENVALEVKREG
jgi:hypothetical protein